MSTFENYSDEICPNLIDLLVRNVGKARLNLVLDTQRHLLDESKKGHTKCEIEYEFDQMNWHPDSEAFLNLFEQKGIQCEYKVIGEQDQKKIRVYFCWVKCPSE